MTTDQQFSVLKGKLPTALANAVLDLIYEYTDKGMEVDEVCSVGLTVIADIARNRYGNEYISSLSALLLDRAKMPPPKERGRA